MNVDKYIAFIFGLPKTIYFNIKYFGVKDGIRLPVIISNRVCLTSVKGTININAKKKFGMIQIGFGYVEIFDRKKSRTIWSVNGTVNFEGSANIGHGSKISVGGELNIGDGCSITAESSIVCNNKISIGSNSLISWDNLIMDTDLHKIYDNNENIINKDKEIVIGKNVWIGCRCTILKGTIIPDNNVLAANSLTSREFSNSNVIIGGNPSKILRENVSWGR